MVSSAVDLVRATDAAEACAVLRDANGGGRILNGGTEIARQLREEGPSYDVLVDIKGIPGMGEVARSDGALSIGASVKHWDIGVHPVVGEAAPMLAQACGNLGNVRVRAQGSLGGNLAYGHAQTDPGTALVAHGARLEMTSAEGSRQLDIHDVWVSDCKTSMRPDELCTRIDVDPLPEGWRWAYKRVEILHRPPSVNVGLLLSVEGDAIADLRVGVGAVGARPRRLVGLEDRLRGEPLDAVPALLRERKREVADELEPVADQVFSATDKVDVTRNVLRRLFEQAGAA